MASFGKPSHGFNIEGARVGVAIAYILGAIVAIAAAAVLWRRPARRATA